MQERIPRCFDNTAKDQEVLDSRSTCETSRSQAHLTTWLSVVFLGQTIGAAAIRRHFRDYNASRAPKG